MDIDDITWRLAQLASLPFQERYVIGGDAEEYVVDSELLENVHGLKFLLQQPQNRNILNNDQITALEDLFIYIEKRSGEALSSKSQEEGALLVRESDIWKTLRSKAGVALSLFGISVDQMSATEVARLSE